MGFEFKRFSKGVYVDGHKRSYVIEYMSKFWNKWQGKKPFDVFKIKVIIFFI